MANANDIPQPSFLSSPKVATLCGVTRNTVCCWIREGKLPSYRTAGGKNLVRPSDLLHFMEAGNMFAPDALRALVAEERPAASEESETRTTTTEPSILVVDDDPSARKLAVRCLGRLDLPVLEAETGYEALHMLLQRPEVALVVLDLVMPGQHGTDTFNQIHGQYPGMPVIVVTGYDIEEMRERFEDAKPDLMLAKPYNPTHLADAARAFLSDVGI